MSVIHIFRIPQVVELTTGTGVLMNYPVNRTDFTIPRYVDTEVEFWVKNVDRRAVNLTNMSATLHLMEPTTGRMMLSRDLEILEATRGLVRFFISAEESGALPLMGLRYSVVLTRGDGVQTMLYTDRDRHGLGVVDVVNGPYPPPIEPYSISVDEFVVRTGKKYSGAYPGAATVLNMGGQHSVVLDMSDYSGTFTVQGSLESSPSSADSDWFHITSTTFNDATEKRHIAFEGNLLWVRFVLSNESAGLIDLITYRN